jgi:hypothetical protein
MSDDWLSGTQIEKLFDANVINSANLQAWRRHGCQALGRKRLGVRKRGRVWLYRRSHVELISAALQQARGGLQADGSFTDKAGGRWLPAEIVTAFRPGTLHRWQKNCWHLPGGRLRAVRKLVWGAGRRGFRLAWFYSEADLQALQSAQSITPTRAAGEEVPAWVSGAEAKVCLGVEAWQASYWSRHDHPDLGRTVRKDKQPRGCRMVNVYSAADLQVVADHAFGDKMSDADWLTQGEAAKAFGLSGTMLHWWGEHGCQYLDGRKLRPRRQVRVGSGRYATVLAWPKEDLQLIAAGLKNSPAADAPHEDKDGTVWLTARRVEKETGIARHQLIYYRTHKLQYLGGRKLRGKQIRRVGTHVKNHGRIWVYHQEDIHKIVAGRKGETAESKEAGATVSASSGVVAGPTVEGDDRTGPMNKQGADPRRGRGRPEGRSQQTEKKYAQMRDDWKAERFDSVAELARHYHMSRPQASKVINGRV